MASGITTAQQLQDVLDAIHDNISQMDVYQGLSELGSLRLCWNDISRTATIFKRINDEENREEVVCTFNPENIVIGTDTFQGKMLKNIIHHPITTVTRSNDVGLGGYVGLKTLIRNICAALGVNLAPNFDEVNPTIYGELVNIVKKYYGDSLQNNAPYGLARKDTTSGGTTTTTYNSYIPVMIIVDIAIYLNGLGVFNANIDKLYTCGYPYIFNIGNNGSTGTLDYDFESKYAKYKSLVPSVSDYFTLNAKSTFFKDSYNFISNCGLHTERFDILFNTLKNTYYSDFDESNVLLMSLDTDHLYIFEFPTSCGYCQTSYLKIYNNNTDYVVKIYSANYRSNTQEVTVNKVVEEHLIDTFYTNNSNIQALRNCYANINFNSYYKFYIGEEFRTSSNARYKPFDSYPKLSASNRYDNIKFIPINRYTPDSVDRYYLIRYNNSIFADLTDKDLVIFCYYIKPTSSGSVYTHRVYIFKNVNSISSNRLPSISEGSLNNYNIITKEEYRNDEWVVAPYIVKYHTNVDDNLINKTLNFYSNVNYMIYECEDFSSAQTLDALTLTLVNSGTTDSYTFSKLNETDPNSIWLTCSNIGELVEIQEDSALEGITLQDNATYPSSVIDYNTFNSTYPDWGKIGYSQPYFEEDQIAGTYTAQWAAISVDSDTPTSQADSQSGEIDFTDTDLVDDIIDDIDNADDGNDEEEVDPNSDEIEGEGETPDDELDRIEPNVLTGGFIKQYALDAKQMGTLAECLTNPDLLQTVVRSFRDPMQAIVSLQLAYKLPLHSTSNSDIILYGFDWASLTNKPQGKMLSTNIADFDFGTVHIDPLYNTYQDITTTSMELYLPCVGFIPLNPAEFLDRGLDVEGKIDTLSGTIVYDISAYDGTKRKLLYQKTGNCQLQLPISSNDNSAIFGALMGVGGMALGGFTGNPLLMAQGAAMTGASVAQGPNYEHGGSISANAGLMTKMIPCVIIKRNQVYNPTHLNELHGLPANSYVKLGSCSGYTVVQDVKVDIQGATQSEKSQIETLLKGGVIL